MDDKRDSKKDKKIRKSRSRSRSPSQSYGRRRRERSRSRERHRRRSPPEPTSPPMRRRRGRRSPSPPPPPMLQEVPPPPPMIGSANAYMGTAPAMYDNYGGYAAAPPPQAYMTAGYGGYDYGASVATMDSYGTMVSAPPPIMMAQPMPPGNEYSTAPQGWSAAPPVPQETDEEKRKREAAIALEVRNQRASLKKQRDDYLRRAGALKRELKTLKQQREDLSAGREPPSPTTNNFIKENDKLQHMIACA